MSDYSSLSSLIQEPHYPQRDLIFISSATIKPSGIPSIGEYLFACHRSRTYKFHPPKNRWLRSLLLGETFSIGSQRTSPVCCRYSLPKVRGHTLDFYFLSRYCLAFVGGRYQKYISVDCRLACFLLIRLNKSIKRFS